MIDRSKGFRSQAVFQAALRKLQHIYSADKIQVWLLIGTFIFSFGYALIYQIPQVSDSRGHHGIAVNLVTRGSFCLECDSVPLHEDKAIYWIGPGYQFFLAGIYTLFDVRPWVVWLFQSVMHTAVVAMLWRLMRRIVPFKEPYPWWYRMPLFLYAFHPDVVQIQGMLMSESLFLFLMVGAIVLLEDVLSSAPEKKSRLKYWATILALSVFAWGAFTVRQAAAGLVLLIFVFLAWKRRWKESVLFIGVTSLLLVPWTVRNYYVFDRLVFNSVAGGLNSWVGYHPDLSGEFVVIPEIAEKIEGLSPAERESVSVQELKKIASNDPMHMGVRTFQKGFKLFALTKTSGFWFHYFGSLDQWATVVGSIVFNFLLLTLGFAAMTHLLLSWRVHDWRIAFLSLLALLLVAPPILTVVINRYRIPILPLFVILSVFWLTQRKHRLKNYSLVIALLFLFFATTVDLWGAHIKVLEHIKRIQDSV